MCQATRRCLSYVFQALRDHNVMLKVVAVIFFGLIQSELEIQTFHREALMVSTILSKVQLRNDCMDGSRHHPPNVLMEKGSLLASITKQNVVANNLMNVPVLYNIRTASKKTSQFFHVPYLTPPQKNPQILDWTLI